MEMPRFEPVAAGYELQWLTLCYAAANKLGFFGLDATMAPESGSFGFLSLPSPKGYNGVFVSVHRGLFRDSHRASLESAPP